MWVIILQIYPNTADLYIPEPPFFFFFFKVMSVRKKPYKISLFGKSVVYFSRHPKFDV